MMKLAGKQNGSIKIQLVFLAFMLVVVLGGVWYVRSLHKGMIS